MGWLENTEIISCAGLCILKDKFLGEIFNSIFYQIPELFDGVRVVIIKFGIL
jgi:hypothetical protein